MALDASLVALAVYNVGYALPFAVVPVLVLVMGDSCRSILDRINNVLTAIADRLMPLLMLLLGLALIADSVSYFARGEPLF